MWKIIRILRITKNGINPYSFACPATTEIHQSMMDRVKRALAIRKSTIICKK
jgi:hypothetical protein